MGVIQRKGRDGGCCAACCPVGLDMVLRQHQQVDGYDKAKFACCGMLLHCCMLSCGLKMALRQHQQVDESCGQDRILSRSES